VRSGDEPHRQLELLQGDRRTADALRKDIDIYLDAVSYFNERDSTIHAVVFLVEGHCSFDVSRPCTCAIDRKSQGLGFRNATYGKGPGTSKVVGPVWTIFVDLNVIKGFSETLKKSLLLSLPSFIPLPLSTEAA